MQRTIELDVGASITALIDARLRWNDTWVRVPPGQVYRFEAKGWWVDRRTKCDPDGYPSPGTFLRACEWLRRCPCADWFALIGAIERRRPMFVIGSGREWSPKTDGTLSCFANDVCIMYRNNKGSVELTIRRVK